MQVKVETRSSSAREIAYQKSIVTARVAEKIPGKHGSHPQRGGLDDSELNESGPEDGNARFNEKKDVHSGIK